MVVSGGIVFEFYVLLALALKPIFRLAPVLALSLLFAVAQYWLGKRLALRSVRATDLTEDEYPEVHRRVETLAEEMGIEKPRLVVGQMGSANAFAVGRRGAGVLAVSETMLNMVRDDHMTMDELEGILAHEVSHIKNRDVVIMVLGQAIASIVGVVAFLAVDLVLDDIPIVDFLVAYLVSIAVQMLVMVFVLAISRYREYVADADAARATDNPTALATGLGKVAEVGHMEETQDPDRTVSALCFFGAERGLLSAIFATHPPTEERIERLQSMTV